MKTSFNILALRTHTALLVVSVIAALLARSRRNRLIFVIISNFCAWLLHRYLLKASAAGALLWAKRQIDEFIAAHAANR